MWYAIILALVITWVRFKKKRIINKVEDDFFGQMMFDDTKYLVQKTFRPTETNIELEITIDGNQLPGQEQKTFFVTIENQYEKLIDKMVPIIENEVKNWHPDFEIKDFKSEFFLDWMTIPKQKNGDWEMGFSSIHDESHSCTVYLNGLKPHGVHIDG
jgi:hypothetical protein